MHSELRDATSRFIVSPGEPIKMFWERNEGFKCTFCQFTWDLCLLPSNTINMYVGKIICHKMSSTKNACFLRERMDESVAILIAGLSSNFFFQDITSLEEAIVTFLQIAHLLSATVSASICMVDIYTCSSPYSRLSSCKDHRSRHSLATLYQLFQHCLPIEHLLEITNSTCYSVVQLRESLYSWFFSLGALLYSK